MEGAQTPGFPLPRPAPPFLALHPPFSQLA